MLLKQLYEVYQAEGEAGLRAYLADHQIEADIEGLIAQLEAFDAPAEAAQVNSFLERIMQDLDQHGAETVRQALRHAGVAPDVIAELLRQANQQLALKRMLRLYREEGAEAVRARLESSGVAPAEVTRILQHLQES